MSIYRQCVVHKSNTAFLEAKMLLLYIFLMSWCLPGSMGDAIREFQENLKALLAPMNKEAWVQVPTGKFQCNLVPCQLRRTIEGLKDSFKNDQTRRCRIRISRLEKNVNHIISALNKGHTQPEGNSSCPMTELPQRTVLRHFQKYFEKRHEKCPESW